MKDAIEANDWMVNLQQPGHFALANCTAWLGRPANSCATPSCMCACASHASVSVQTVLLHV